jgi:hypothetical protein
MYGTDHHSGYTYIPVAAVRLFLFLDQIHQTPIRLRYPNMSADPAICVCMYVCTYICVVYAIQT